MPEENDIFINSVPSPDEPLSQADWIDLCSTPGFGTVEFDREYAPGSRFIADHLESFLLNANEQTLDLDDAGRARAIWSIFGSLGGFFEMILHEADRRDQIRVYSSLASFYRVSVPLLCPGDIGSDTSVAIYMIWDMGSCEVPLHHPSKWPHLMPIIENCFEMALSTTDNPTAIQSVLHALKDAIYGSEEVAGLCHRLAKTTGVSLTTRDSLIEIAGDPDDAP